MKGDTLDYDVPGYLYDSWGDVRAVAIWARERDWRFLWLRHRRYIVGWRRPVKADNVAISKEVAA